MAGLEAPVELTWASIIPDDPMADAQTAILQMQLGVSKRTLLAQMGFDPDVEEEQKSDEDEQASEALARQMAQGGFADPTGAKNRPGQMSRRAGQMADADGKG
jgi:hypothetical protein